jgi:Na+:H+ antiporter, NhaC family
MIRKPKSPTLFAAILPVIVLTLAISFNVFVFKNESLAGSNQIILLISAAIAVIVCLYHGNTWENILQGIVKSMGSAIPAILILLMIGALAGTWLISGIVPAMIYYGLQIIHPSVFLVTAAVICAVVSLATGSSWSTVATIGIALLGIGRSMGISDAMIGGAIISGAYFGDKISPLSDTTNLASAITNTELFTHIKYMMLTTVPSFIITLIIFLILGFREVKTLSGDDVVIVQQSLKSVFHISPWLFLVPVLVIFLIIKKVPALPAIFIGTIAGAIVALIFQPHLIQSLYDGDAGFWKRSYVVIMKAMYTRTNIPSDNALISNLLSTGGMQGMLNTIWLIISAMVFGGVMEAGGLLTRITRAIISFAKNTVSLISSTVATCLFLNVTASDQYLSIVIPGKMFTEIFKTRGLHSKNLSRTLEDAGTVTSVLVPWNTCGATQSTVLGVSTIVYLPFCFFNIISPLMSIFYAALNIRIARIKSKAASGLD